MDRFSEQAAPLDDNGMPLLVHINKANRHGDMTQHHGIFRSGLGSRMAGPGLFFKDKQPVKNMGLKALRAAYTQLAVPSGTHTDLHDLFKGQSGQDRTDITFYKNDFEQERAFAAVVLALGRYSPRNAINPKADDPYLPVKLTAQAIERIQNKISPETELEYRDYAKNKFEHVTERDRAYKLAKDSPRLNHDLLKLSYSHRLIADFMLGFGVTYFLRDTYIDNLQSQNSDNVQHDLDAIHKLEILIKNIGNVATPKYYSARLDGRLPINSPEFASSVISSFIRRCYPNANARDILLVGSTVDLSGGHIPDTSQPSVIQ